MGADSCEVFKVPLRDIETTMGAIRMMAEELKNYGHQVEMSLVVEITMKEGLGDAVGRRRV